MERPILSFDDYKADSGERLRKLLKVMKLRQTEAAEAMGVTKHVLRNWLAGENPIQVYPLYRFCRLKNVDFNYVYLGDWSQLPHHLSSALEQEALSKLDRRKASEHREVESS